ncbi:MAG: LPS-assembly protein LptD, partial [Burkholderiaceae bacterium]|nr:LPS-assembly protein LptD [Burkholderiaceae bacterium]
MPAGLALMALHVPAQASDGLVLELEPSDALVEQVRGAQDPTPTFVSGQQVGGEADVSTIITGDAQLRRRGVVIQADKIEHDLVTDNVLIEGNVRVN